MAILRIHVLVLAVVMATAAVTLEAASVADAGTGGSAASALRALPEPLPMPSVGLTRDQSVRLSAVNLGTAELTLAASLRNSGGVLASKTLVLAPRQIGQLTVSGARRGLVFDTRGRLQVWGQFAVPAGASLAGSVEVFDNTTGTTQVLVNADLPEPLPRPVLVSGPMGVRAGQLARVSVVNLGPDPITVSAGILQADAVQTKLLTLAPGEARWVEIDPVKRDLTLDRSGRVQIRARVACRNLDCLVFATLEVYAKTNGHSSEADPMVTPIQLP
jgi:hypothetical protein